MPADWGVSVLATRSRLTATLKMKLLVVRHALVNSITVVESWIWYRSISEVFLRTKSRVVCTLRKKALIVPSFVVTIHRCPIIDIFCLKILIEDREGSQRIVSTVQARLRHVPRFLMVIVIGHWSLRGNTIGKPVQYSTPSKRRDWNERRLGTRSMIEASYRRLDSTRTVCYSNNYQSLVELLGFHNNIAHVHCDQVFTKYLQSLFRSRKNLILWMIFHYLYSWWWRTLRVKVCSEQWYDRCNTSAFAGVYSLPHAIMSDG